MEDKRKTLESYFHKDEFGNYVISEFEDLGFDLDFEELNLLYLIDLSCMYLCSFTKSLNIIGNYIEYLQKELSKSNEKLKKIEEYITSSNEKLKKIEEYITSYESISTIQGLNDTKENKNLDKNTMVEMTNRYLKIHDKILSIIKGDE